MPVHDQQSDVSLWYPKGHTPRHPPLTSGLETSVAVVGAGITGLTAALNLAEAGLKVVVLEARTIGSGVTGGTTAHLTEAIDTRYHTLEARFGSDAIKLAARSSRAAITHIAARAKGLRCGYEVVPGYLYCESASDLHELEREKAAARQAGCRVRLEQNLDLPFPVAGALCFEGQAQIDAGAYLEGLRRKCLEKGVQLFESSRVMSITDGEPCTVELENGVLVRANHVFSATHDPNTFLSLQTAIAHYRSYAVAIRRLSIPPGLYWDTMDPYHYLRMAETNGSSYLIVGGEDHKTGTESHTGGAFEALGRYTEERFGKVKPAFRWSAQVIEPVDGLPFIGRRAGDERVFIATGYSGNGMTFGTVAALLISDLVLGKKNEWEELYKPSRIKPMAGALDYIKENASLPAHFIGDRLSKGEVGSLAEIKPGEGKTLKLDGERLAVYRTAAGALKACSAVCTHLGCLVHFNDAERTWDCPCHGSRFSITGEVLDGPATKGLERIDLAQPKKKRKSA